MNLSIQYTLNLVYKFKSIFYFFIINLFTLLVSIKSYSALPINYTPIIKYSDWNSFEKSVLKNQKINEFRGNSEVWTGGLALLLGLLGDSVSSDPLEKGVYTIFQSVGVGSIGLGLYDKQIGSEDQKIYKMKSTSPAPLSIEQKNDMVTNYSSVKNMFNSKENTIKLITFSLISVTQFYNGSRIQNSSVKNTLYFIGAVNALVAISFAF